MQRVAILGATGSIGTNTLDVIARHPDRFVVHALTASSRVDEMLALCQRHVPTHAVMAQPEAAQALRVGLRELGLPVQVHEGPQALIDVAQDPEVDVVMAAIVGAAGLAPCLAAARAGKRLLLANKEALVVGGDLFMRAVQEGGATLLPIDSEHSAVFQSLPEDPATWTQRVARIVLTASGGPLRTRDPKSLRDVTPQEACAHPNWVMGQKISVDSATMMNKALEVIEARYLFGLPPSQLDVVIHPQSVVHSMVAYHDTSVVAQLGTPDMRVPIAYGLSWPERMTSGATPLDFHALAGLSFEAIDAHGHPERFPGLKLAWESLAAQPGSCAVLNAANEVAVAAFLANSLRFDQIAAVNAETLSQVVPSKLSDLDDLLALDAQARRAAQALVARWARA